MTAMTASETTRRDWRDIAYRIVAVLAVLLALLLFGSLFAILSPWGGPGGEPEAANPEIHRWHSSQWGTLMAILMSGSLLASLRRPRENPVLVQFAVVALLIFFVVGLVVEGFSPDMILFPVIAGLLAATYPNPRALTNFAPAGSMSIPLMALTLVAAVALAPNFFQSVQLQMGHVAEHAELGHWLGSAVLNLWLVLGGVLAATRRGGWRTMGTIVGVAFLYLGVAALSIPAHDGSWGTMGGILSALGGLAFIGTTLYEARSSDAEQVSTPAVA